MREQYTEKQKIEILNLIVSIYFKDQPIKSFIDNDNQDNPYVLIKNTTNNQKLFVYFKDEDLDLNDVELLDEYIDEDETECVSKLLCNSDIQKSFSYVLGYISEVFLL